jgi:hypothetical protein
MGTTPAAAKAQPADRVLSEREVIRTRRSLFLKVRSSASAKVTAGPDAARSQDFLYDEEGLPGDPWHGPDRAG